MNDPKPPVTTPDGIVHDTPVPSSDSDRRWGSDAIAETLRRLELPYIALNPGASYRGLHDSIVNYLGNKAPQMLLCLHDEHAVHIAQGYAKVTDRMMAAALHSNVGLMHATMPVFDAWCDRVPVMVIGANGPWDAARRRPWIDWIHTCTDQAALVRDFTKWDNQPASVPAAIEALLRASQIAQTAPRGPVYVNLDVSLQEDPIAAMPAMPDMARYRPAEPVRPSDEQVARVARLLSGAKRPVLLCGRVSRSLEAWNTRVAFAEKLNMPVVTSIKLAAAFPTSHRLHVAPPANKLAPAALAAVREADVIVSLDWLDLGGALRQAFGSKPVSAKVVQISCDQHNHRGWSMDYHMLPPVDEHLMCEPDAAVPLLLAACNARSGDAPTRGGFDQTPAPTDEVTLKGVGEALSAELAGVDYCFTRLPLGWHGSYTAFDHPLATIGADGGAGVGAGPGISVGAALALKGTGRVPIALMGDGDFMMGNSALWTAAHYGIPMLVLVCNNRSFFNDERHQEEVAKHRGRPETNRWIGQHIGDPDIDLAAIGRAQGALGIGPVDTVADLRPAIARGLAHVRAGGVCVIDARVRPGYDGE
jgi:thiamine pyrophosphate-dependent acetolactate synthase large subunit-like protein